MLITPTPFKLTVAEAATAAIASKFTKSCFALTVVPFTELTVELSILAVKLPLVLFTIIEPETPAVPLAATLIAPTIGAIPSKSFFVISERCALSLSPLTP